MIHSIELSERNHKAIEAATGLKFHDSSYKNDSCDSIVHEHSTGSIQIFLPNCEELGTETENFEDFNTYSIRVYDIDHNQLNEETQNATFTQAEIVEEIKKVIL